MDDSRGYFKLGLFVLLTTSIFIGSIVALGAHLFTHAETITVETVISESVAGLDPGSAVKYRGVTIGQVSRIAFADSKYGVSVAQGSAEPQSILVEMSLDPQKFKPLTVEQLHAKLAGMVDRGLRTRLSQSLLSGVTVVEIDYVDPRLYPPAKLAWTPTELLIPSAPSSMSQVVGGVEKLVAQLNAADISGLIHRFDGLVANVDKNVSDLQIATVREKAVALVDEVRVSNRHVSELLASSELKQARSDLPQITGELRNSSARIDTLLHDKRVDAILNGLATNVGPAAADVRRLLQELRELVSSQSENLRIIINNIRDLTDNGRSTVEDLKQNPSRLILGSPPPRTDQGAHP